MGEPGKIDQPEHTALPAVHKTKGLRNFREEPAHPRWRQETGGGERGKLSPREATPSHLANRPQFLSKDFLRPDRRCALGPRREKACRARGEAAQTSGCLGRSPRREKAHRTQGEAAKTSGCLARTRRVLPTHSDICLQLPALPAAGLN